MCVEIVKSRKIISYRTDLPLEEQIEDSKEIIIDCSFNCEKVSSFLYEVEKAYKCGKNLKFTIKLVNSTDLRLFKKLKNINKNILLNDIIHNMTLLYQNTDEKLQELSNIFKN